jgi:hypothetical protein
VDTWPLLQNKQAATNRQFSHGTFANTFIRANRRALSYCVFSQEKLVVRTTSTLGKACEFESVP